MPEETLFATTDFYTSALLVCLGYEIKKITADGRVKKFHFEDTPELRQDILDYMNRKKMGNLRDFRDAIERIKDLVHS